VGVSNMVGVDPPLSMPCLALPWRGEGARTWGGGACAHVWRNVLEKGAASKPYQTWLGHGSGRACLDTAFTVISAVGVGCSGVGWGGVGGTRETE
jgi:hypothetical protein